VIPLIARFPALARVSRVSLGSFPTPVERLDAIDANLWIKRDDRSANPLCGNKVRALEFLLGSVRAGDRVVTVGSAGSTHALAVALYGRRLDAHVLVGRWRQEMNDAATQVSARLSAMAERAPVFRSPVGAFAWATWQRVRGARWIAAGGTTPLGILGHVNAGLELIGQIDAGEIPEPRQVIVPLGTGGTAAGLLLAFAIARRPIAVVGARVVPRVVARRRRVLALANAAAKLIERRTGERVHRPRRAAFTVDHEVYGGAYGRETIEARAAADRMRAAAGIALDATYSAKAFARALHDRDHGPTLFWLTFDSRSLIAEPDAAARSLQGAPMMERRP
jgi:D-cysteine desulfhydrase